MNLLRRKKGKEPQTNCTFPSHPRPPARNFRSCFGTGSSHFPKCTRGRNGSLSRNVDSQKLFLAFSNFSCERWRGCIGSRWTGQQPFEGNFPLTSTDN